MLSFYLVQFYCYEYVIPISDAVLSSETNRVMLPNASIGNKWPVMLISNAPLTANTEA